MPDRPGEGSPAPAFRLRTTDVLPPTADLVVVGAGVVGCAIARELARHPRLRIALVEAQDDVGQGTVPVEVGATTEAGAVSGVMGPLSPPAFERLRRTPRNTANPPRIITTAPPLPGCSSAPKSSSRFTGSPRDGWSAR